MGARGLTEDDPLQLYIADTRDELDVFDQVRKIIENQRVRIGGRRVERLDHRAVADGANLAFHIAFQVLVCADQHTTVFHRGTLATHGDLRLRARLAGVAGRIMIEAFI